MIDIIQIFLLFQKNQIEFIFSQKESFSLPIPSFYFNIFSNFP